MERKRFAGSVEQHLELPGGILTRSAVLEMESNRMIAISGRATVKKCTDDCISLKTRDNTVSVYGRELELDCLSAEGVTVRGIFQRVEFSE